MYLSPHWVMIVRPLAILVHLALKPSDFSATQKELEERV